MLCETCTCYVIYDEVAMILSVDKIAQWDHKRNLAMRTWRSKALQWGKRPFEYNEALMQTYFRAFADLLVVILIKIPQGL